MANPDAAMCNAKAVVACASCGGVLRLVGPTDKNQVITTPDPEAHAISDTPDVDAQIEVIVVRVPRL